MKFISNILKYPKQAPIFIKEVRFELSKVDWLNKKQTIQYTLVVIGVSITVALFLGGLDYIFRFFVNKFIIS